jgi:hypothetical protein
VNRVAEKSLKVKSEWVVHQAHFSKENARGSARSSPALVSVSHCQLFMTTSLDFFVPLPLNELRSDRRASPCRDSKGGRTV